MLPKQKNTNDISRIFDFKKIFLRLLSKWHVILLCSVFTGMAALFVAVNIIKPVYETEFTLCVYSDYSQSPDEFVNDVNFSRNMLNTYAIILESNTVLEGVAKELNYEISVNELKNCVTPIALSDSIALIVKIEHENPLMAKRIADAFAKTSPEKLVAIAKAGWVEIIDTAVIPERPVSPNIKIFAAAGCIIGFALCCMVIALIQLLDTRIYTKEDIEQVFGDIPVVGVIPYTQLRGEKK